MELEIREIAILGKSTLSSLFIDGKWECFVLEDLPRPVKIKKETRIPGGRFRIEKVFSGRFYETYKRRFGHKFAIGIANVPDFQLIRIHIGNKHQETWGCPLVGQSVIVSGGDFVLQSSALAYQSLYNKISAVIDKEEVWVTVNRNQ